MDQDTRNKLQRATQQVRRILEEEFAEQLEGTFDVLPDGKILPEPGKHLDARQRLTRQKLVDAIEHIKAGGKTSEEAVGEYTREAAFTFLNRFVALRMLESRGMLQECVSKGDASSGFKEFCGLAPGLSSLDDDGYRLYLESLFDELTVEVKVLFDRRDPASLLWPRRGALTELLDILGQADLAGVWNADETIGWVYQYFNSGDERRKMREESSAPRNSRELAVRNQFFTPRYVVQFLADNTLARLWYEMRKGQTRIVDEFQYLVRRTSEVFLDEGQVPPPIQDDTKQPLSQEELLKKTVYIPHRAMKDPRDLKILDPACGSGHFLLYAFDLLISIYDEAWHDEASPESEVTGRRLRDDYGELEQLHTALPGLVLAHNLHGIDIDPRAAQIAALALWMRGQRAFNEFQIERKQRPSITRSKIVCAERMPGEAAFLEEFIAKYLSGNAESRFLASLVRKVFEAMKLAGEIGSLLKIEKDIAEEVAKAKKQWLERPEYNQQTLFDVDPAKVQKELDLTRGITDESFWEEAEHRIYDALRSYSELAESGGSFQRRLFAVDAARGFAFIDICRERFDVALMNPPFGKCSTASSSYYNAEYGSFKQDIGIAFVDRFLNMCKPRGCVGAITSRTFLASDSFKEWRLQSLLERRPVHCLLDLGYGVLDDALVEAAAYVTDANSPDTTNRVFIRALESRSKEESVDKHFGGRSTKNIVVFVHDLSDFHDVPLAVMCYWLPASLLAKLRHIPDLKHSGGAAKGGLRTTDDFRCLRLAWEIDADSFTGRGEPWKLMTKGGEYFPYWDDLHVCCKWANDGLELKVFLAQKRLKTQGSPDWSPWLNHHESYFEEGLTCPERTTSDYCPRVMPRNILFSTTGQAVQFDSRDKTLAYLCGAHTRLYKLIVESFVGSGDNAFPGSAAKHYRAGLLNKLPPPLVECDESLRQFAEEATRYSQLVFERDETARNYCPHVRRGSLRRLALDTQESMLRRALVIIENSKEVETKVSQFYRLAADEEAVLNEIIGPHPSSYPSTQSELMSQIPRLWQSSISEVVEEAAELRGPRRQLTKKTYIIDRRLELISHLAEMAPEAIVDTVNSCEVLPQEALREVAFDEASHALGCAFGRWDIRHSMGDRGRDVPADIFSELPAVSAGTLQNADGTPLAKAEFEDIVGYPTPIAWDGILVDDEGGDGDIIEFVRQDLRAIWKDDGDDVEKEMCSALGVASLRTFFASPSGFFSEHIRQYSKSRRKAPIYWQVATQSTSYSVWLYYHRFNRDTFFKVLNEYLAPKLQHERQKLERLRSEAGAEPTRSQRKGIEDRETFVSELVAMVEEVERIAPLWNPNLNDGVIINFAPLWRLVPQNKSWQKECKKCWDKLVKGEYDWAHLAMHLWPERVVPKCVVDASLAIAHGLEEEFWELDDRARFQAKEEPQGGWGPVIKELVAERTSPAVKAALESLLTAPVAAAKSTRRKKAKAS